jgi:hypothetical protein
MKMKEIEKILKEIEQNNERLKNDIEKTAFLLELDKKYELSFCGRNEDIIHFKDPSTCGGCVQGQNVMRSLFENYTELPFVEFHGDRCYTVDLGLAKLFVKEGQLGVDMENEKRELKKAAKELKEQEKKASAKEKELVKKYGDDITKVPGLLENLLSEESSIVDVKVDPKKGVAAYIVDKHWWSSGSGIGMASVITVYRDGKEDSESLTYRDQYNASRDDWSKSFHKIKIEEITPKKVSVKAFPAKDYSPRTFSFNIAKGKKAKAEEEAEISLEEKTKFLTEVKKRMNEVVGNHQHNHPLYKPTEISEFKIDYNNNQAAFVLFEQIDTDRCTPEGEGWLGDQYRYSVWHIKQGKKPEQMYENHAYIRRTVSALTGTKGRDPVIKNLELSKDKIEAIDGEGNGLEFKLK